MIHKTPLFRRLKLQSSYQFQKYIVSIIEICYRENYVLISYISRMISLISLSGKYSKVSLYVTRL